MRRTMIYMTPSNRNLVGDRDIFTQSLWGQILTPASFANAPKAAVWCGDNEIFTGKYRFWRFYRWLWRKRPHRRTCIFINAPDWLEILPDKTVRGSAWRTWLRYLCHFWLIRTLGFPVAYVAQDGSEHWPFPPFCNAVFIGGSTEWKMSPAADQVIYQAKKHGLWVHVGRVNSQSRIRHFKLVGVDSVDGTSPTYAPDRDFWRFQSVLMQPSLFTLPAPSTRPSSADGAQARRRSGGAELGLLEKGEWGEW